MYIDNKGSVLVVKWKGMTTATEFTQTYRRPMRTLLSPLSLCLLCILARYSPTLLQVAGEIRGAEIIHDKRSIQKAQRVRLDHINCPYRSTIAEEGPADTDSRPAV